MKKFIVSAVLLCVGVGALVEPSSINADVGICVIVKSESCADKYGAAPPPPPPGGGLAIDCADNCHVHFLDPEYPEGEWYWQCNSNPEAQVSNLDGSWWVFPKMTVDRFPVYPEKGEMVTPKPLWLCKVKETCGNCQWSLPHLNMRCHVVVEQFGISPVELILDENAEPIECDGIEQP